MRRALGRGVRTRRARRPVTRPFRAWRPLEVPGGLVAVLKVAGISKLFAETCFILQTYPTYLMHYFYSS